MENLFLRIPLDPNTAFGGGGGNPIDAYAHLTKS